MDQLFTVDNMATQAVLGATCGQLSLEDLLSFEEVTSATGNAVAAHQYQQIVTLGSDHPELTARLTDPDNGEQLAGPTLTRVAIILSLCRETFQYMLADESVTKHWHLMLATIGQRAAHLKELKLHFYSDSFTGPSTSDTPGMSEAEFQAMNLYADSLLAGVSFSQCTELTIEYEIRPANLHKLHLLPNFLRHFPVLESLVLDGDRLPAISALPAPQRLKKLELTICEHENQLLPGEPAICNFSGLEQFTLHSFGCMFDEEMASPENITLLGLLTGVDWMASFLNHPPRNLQRIAIPCLAPWTLSFLEAIITLSWSSCRTLAVGNLGLEDDELPAVPTGGPVGRFLRNLTHLKITSNARKERVSQFLSLTPSLSELKLNICMNAMTWRETAFDANHGMRHLTKLVLTATQRVKEVVYSSVVTQDWVDTVRRNASPAGLEIKVSFWDWRSSETEVVNL